jgi:hypothetical protein
MPLEKVVPTTIPALAMIMMMKRGAALDPMEELRKLTASLLTPTMRSDIARANRMITMIK